jgi:hypothetical protein
MNEMPGSGADPGDSPRPVEPPGPKRGAFPTPRSEIEKAKPYIPDNGEKDDDPGEKPGPSADLDGEKEE